MPDRAKKNKNSFVFCFCFFKIYPRTCLPAGLLPLLPFPPSLTVLVNNTTPFIAFTYTPILLYRIQLTPYLILIIPLSLLTFYLISVNPLSHFNYAVVFLLILISFAVNPLSHGELTVNFRLC